MKSSIKDIDGELSYERLGERLRSALRTMNDWSQPIVHTRLGDHTRFALAEMIYSGALVNLSSLLTRSPRLAMHPPREKPAQVRSPWAGSLQPRTHTLETAFRCAVVEIGIVPIPLAPSF